MGALLGCGPCNRGARLADEIVRSSGRQTPCVEISGIIQSVGPRLTAACVATALWSAGCSDAILEALTFQVAITSLADLGRDGAISPIHAVGDRIAQLFTAEKPFYCSHRDTHSIEDVVLRRISTACGL